jgi:protein-disulfide isomerase
MLALASTGLALSILLARLHAQAHAGVASFCTISDVVNCNRVATSRFAILLGLPVAIWGAFGYGLAAALAAWGLSRRRLHGGWPTGLLFLLAAATVLASVALALVSEFVIGAWCLLCVGSWAVSALLLAAAWGACRARGVGAAVRADLTALWQSPFRAAALAGAPVVAVTLASAAYPRYWERAMRASPPVPSTSRATAAVLPGAAARPASRSSAVVVEYSDYECPFCARAHEETRLWLAGRPDVKLVRRQFPLDDSCNPALKKQIHLSACALARAAICAEAQGRLPEMDDALFQNQGQSLPVLTLAARIGLDVERFRACLGAPETERRLAADIAAGMRDGVRATPTYVVGQMVRSGQFPAELLPSRASQGAR